MPRSPQHSNGTLLDLHCPDRPNLDTALASLASGGNLAGPFNGFIEAFAIQNVIAGKLLLFFREGAIRREDLSITVLTDCDRRGRWLQRLGAVKNAALSRLIHHGAVFERDASLLLRSDGRFTRVDQHHVTHLDSLSAWR